jgi:hypothetical protein
VVVGVADRVKTLASQGSDGSFSELREDDILTTTLATPEHRGWVRGMSTSLGWSTRFVEEFARMYWKKRRNKRSDDMTDITFKIVVHAIRLSGIEISKNVLLPSQLLVHVSNSKEEDMHGREEEDVHDSEEEHAHDREEDACGRGQEHLNANED